MTKQILLLFFFTIYLINTINAKKDVIMIEDFQEGFGKWKVIRNEKFQGKKKKKRNEKTN